MPTSERRTGLARPLLLIAAVACAVTAAASPAVDPTARVDVRAALAPGALALESSAPNSTLVTAARMRPGQSAAGAVTLTNTGALAGDLELVLSIAAERAGSGGGRLSEVLRWRLADDAGDFAVSGPASGSIAAGGLAPGQSRRFRLTTELPSAVGNEYQGAQATVDLTWHASAGGAAAGGPEPIASPGPGIGSVLPTTARGRARLIIGPFRWRLTRRGARLSGRAGCTLPPCALRTWGWISIGHKKMGWGMAGGTRSSATSKPSVVVLRTSRRGAKIVRRARRAKRRVSATVFVRVTARDGTTWLVKRRVKVFRRTSR